MPLTSSTINDISEKCFEIDLARCVLSDWSGQLGMRMKEMVYKTHLSKPKSFRPKHTWRGEDHSTWCHYGRTEPYDSEIRKQLLISQICVGQNSGHPAFPLSLSLPLFLSLSLSRPIQKWENYGAREIILPLSYLSNRSISQTNQ